MPRGRAQGYELQRETILARAAALFAKNGYSATSMNEVAEACGVSKPSLYHYVSDKHQLLYLMEGQGSIRLDGQDHDVTKGMGVYLGPSESASIRATAAPVKIFHLVVPQIPK